MSFVHKPRHSEVCDVGSNPLLVRSDVLEPIRECRPQSKDEEAGREGPPSACEMGGNLREDSAARGSKGSVPAASRAHQGAYSTAAFPRSRGLLSGTISIEQMSGKTSGRQSLRHSISSLSRPAMDMRFRLGIAFGSFSLFGRRSTNSGWNPLMAPSLSWRRKPGRNWGQCSMS